MSDYSDSDEDTYDNDEAFDLDLFTTVEEDRQAAPLHMKSLCEAGASEPTGQQIPTDEAFKAELRDALTSLPVPVPKATRIFHNSEDEFFGAVVLANYWFARDFRGEDFWDANSRQAVKTGDRFEYNLYAGASYLEHRPQSADRHVVWHRTHPNYHAWYAQLPDFFKHFVNAGGIHDTDEAMAHREAFIEAAVTPNHYEYKGYTVTRPLWWHLLVYLGEL